MANMTTIQDWAHLSTPGIIRARSRVLADNSRRLRSDLISARKKADMSQADVAAILGVSPQAVSKMERYDSDPKLSTLERYANVVGVIIDSQVREDNGTSLIEADSTGWSIKLSSGPTTAGGPTRLRQLLEASEGWSETRASVSKTTDFALAS